MTSSGLPSGWTLATLPDLVGTGGLITDGDWVESKDQDESGSIRLTQLADVGDGWFRNRSQRFLRPDQAERLGCTLLRQGDVLIARMPDPLGRACVFPGLTQPAVTVVDVCIVRLNPNDVSPTWLTSFINSPLFRVAVAGEQRGSTRKRISKGSLSELALPVPPTKEQERIADAVDSYLSRLDVAVATLEAAQVKLKAYRASVLKASVEGRLVPTEAALARAEKRDFEPANVLLKRILSERRRRWEEAELAKLKTAGKSPRDGKWKAKYEEPKPPDTEGLPELPEGWCWVSFEQVTSLITSGSRGWAEYYVEEGATFIRAQDIKTDALVLEDIAHVSPPNGAEGSRTAVQRFDLLVTITGANVTKTALVEHDLGEAYVSQHVGLCRPVDSAIAPYLHTFVVCPSAGRRYLERAAYGAGKPGLNLDNLKQMALALPPADEAPRIVDAVDQFVGEAQQMELAAARSLRRISRLRQAVLKWAFEGKLVDQDPNDESAERLLERIRTARASTETPKRTRRAPITE